VKVADELNTTASAADNKPIRMAERVGLELAHS